MFVVVIKLRDTHLLAVGPFETSAVAEKWTDEYGKLMEGFRTEWVVQETSKDFDSVDTPDEFTEKMNTIEPNMPTFLYGPHLAS